MILTYDQIKREVKGLALEIANSKEIVPSVISSFRYVMIPAALYFFFSVVCLYTDVYIKDLWLILMFFSVVVWVFISIVAVRLQQFSSMIPKNAGERYGIVRLYRKKVKVYYFIWNFTIVVSGLVAILTNFNVLALFVLNFIFSAVVFISFNMDISRYQLSSVLGVLSAMEEKINRRGD